jgi:hypothetical protein
MSDELYIDGDRYLLAGNIARSDGYVRDYVARPMSREQSAQPSAWRCGTSTPCRSPPSSAAMKVHAEREAAHQESRFT